jgi:pantoate--beta-alanine ligase
MGFLHDGHLSLVKKSKESCDITIVSIFVNPTQFAPSEDLGNYPRDLERDKTLLLDQGVDFLFFPSVEEIYPQNFQTFVNVESITKRLEGEFRPSHFRGVTTIVNILFNCVNPDFAFFGQKDAQQATVIKQMVADLNMKVEIIVCPIVREPDGLAMSSRNVYLAEKERIHALVLYKSLQLAKKMILEGERRCSVVLAGMLNNFKDVESAKLDYIKIVDSTTFEIVDELEPGEEYYVLIACRIGNTRLIDNELVSVK